MKLNVSHEDKCHGLVERFILRKRRSLRRFGERAYSVHIFKGDSYVCMHYNYRQRLNVLWQIFAYGYNSYQRTVLKLVMFELHHRTNCFDSLWKLCRWESASWWLLTNTLPTVALASVVSFAFEAIFIFIHRMYSC